MADRPDNNERGPLLGSDELQAQKTDKRKKWWDRLSFIRLAWLTAFFPLLGALVLPNIMAPHMMATLLPTWFAKGVTFLILGSPYMLGFYLGFVAITAAIFALTKQKFFEPLNATAEQKEEAKKTLRNFKKMLIASTIGCLIYSTAFFLAPSLLLNVVILLTGVSFLGATIFANRLPTNQNKDRGAAPKKAQWASRFCILSMGCLVLNSLLAFTKYTALAGLIGNFALVPAAIIALAAPALLINYLSNKFDESTARRVIATTLKYAYIGLISGLGAYYWAVHAAALSATVTATFGAGVASTAVGVGATIGLVAPPLGLAILAAVMVSAGTAIATKLFGKLKSKLNAKVQTEAKDANELKEIRTEQKPEAEPKPESTQQTNKVAKDLTTFGVFAKTKLATIENTKKEKTTLRHTAS